MSSMINTYVTNWVKVKNDSIIEEHVTYLNEKAECLSGGSLFEVHYHKGQIRITAYDVIDQGLGYYEDEETEEGWIDLEDELVEMLAEGEVLRLTTLSWFKGRLESLDVTVSTWDGRRQRRSIQEWDTEIAQALAIDKKQLKGWN